METISENKFEKELTSWQKMLIDILQENALLKYMLSEIVDENEDKNFLPIAEYFQNELLLKDEKLQILLKRIHEFAVINPKDCDKKHDSKYEKLRLEILHFEKIYNDFSNDFKAKYYKKGPD